jgi:hypothetical protein
VVVVEQQRIGIHADELLDSDGEIKEPLFIKRPDFITAEY